MQKLEVCEQLVKLESRKRFVLREKQRFRDTEKVKIDVKSLDLQENEEVL